MENQNNNENKEVNEQVESQEINKEVNEQVESQEINKEDLEKTSSLLWNEEDYSVMEKITGFDEESVEKDQKKGLTILIFSLICIVALAIGFFLGYKLPQNQTNNQNENVVVEDYSKVIKAAYLKMNASGEVYLYVMDDRNEEKAVASLNKYQYRFVVYEDSLYMLHKESNLILERVNLVKDGYYTVELAKINYEYGDYVITDGNIYVLNDSKIIKYDFSGNMMNQFELENDYLLKFDGNIIVYQFNNNLYTYDSKTQNTTLIAENITQFIDNVDDKFIYLKEGKLYESENELLEFSATSVEKIRYNNKILFTDDNTLYLYENSKIIKVKEFERNVGTLFNYNYNEAIVIYDDYDNNTCEGQVTPVEIFNFNSDLSHSTEINGCISTKILNGFVD